MTNDLLQTSAFESPSPLPAALSDRDTTQVARERLGALLVRVDAATGLRFHETGDRHVSRR